MCDANLLQSSSICGQPLVEGNGVTFLIFPVGDARRNLPVLKRNLNDSKKMEERGTDYWQNGGSW
jgi:hypothetical protein